MTADNRAEKPGPQQDRVASLHLTSLFAGAPGRNGELAPTLAIATEYQQLSWQAPLAEMRLSFKGAPRGTGHALLGRVAAIGEQLSLAWTALEDARRWLNPEANPLAAPMAGRALAEVTGYFTISAGHGFANATYRTLLIHPAARERAGESAALLTDPFTTDARAWISLESDAARKLRRYARATSGDAALELTQIVTSLVKDPAWCELVRTRQRDFHQWRPQSINGGVDPRDPWEPNGAGSRRLTVGMGPTSEPIPAAEAIAIADAALKAITRTAEAWLKTWPYALRDVGAPLHVLPD